MKHFPEFESDVDFIRALIVEQNVFCLPSPVSETSHLSLHHLEIIIFSLGPKGIQHEELFQNSVGLQ